MAYRGKLGGGYLEGRGAQEGLSRRAMLPTSLGTGQLAKTILRRSHLRIQSQCMAQFTRHFDLFLRDGVEADFRWCTKEQAFYVDVIALAMLQNPQTKARADLRGGIGLTWRDERATRKKLAQLLRVAKHEGVVNLILSANVMVRQVPAGWSQAP